MERTCTDIGSVLALRILSAALAVLVWPLIAAAQIWTPGVARNVPFAAYIGAPGTGCANAYAYAAKVGRMPDYFVYYGANGNDVTKMTFETGFSTFMPAFKNAGCNQNIVIKMPLIINSPSSGVFMTFESVAAGTFDTDYFQYAANQIASAGYTTPIIAIGWEENNGYLWKSNSTPIDGGSGSGLMAELVFSGTSLMGATVASPSLAGKNYTTSDTLLTPYGGTCSQTPTLSVSTINASGGVTALTVSNGGNCSNTKNSNGAFAAAFQHVSYLLTHTSGLSGAIIAFDPNCGTPDWTIDYPGDSYVNMIGCDLYDHFQGVNVTGIDNLANGSLAISSQPPAVGSILRVVMDAGSTAVNLGAQVAVAYNLIPTGTNTDTFQLATAANAELQFQLSEPTEHVNTVTISGCTTCSGSKILLVADQPNAKWTFSQHGTDNLGKVTSEAAATSTLCAGAPSACNPNITITDGGSVLAALLETGTYAGPNTGILNAGVFGNDDCYWQDQKFQYLAANNYALDLEFESATGGTSPIYGTGASYTMPCMAGATTQDLAP